MDSFVPSPYSELDLEISLGLHEPMLSEAHLYQCMERALVGFASSSSSSTASTSSASPLPTETDLSYIEGIDDSASMVASASQEMQRARMALTIEPSLLLYTLPEQESTIEQQRQGQAAAQDDQPQERCLFTVHEEEHEDSQRPRARRNRPKNYADDEYEPPAHFTMTRRRRSPRTRKAMKNNFVEEDDQPSLPPSSGRPRPTRRRSATRSPYQKRQFNCPAEDCTQSFHHRNDFERHRRSCHPQPTQAAVLVCPFPNEPGCHSQTGAYTRPDSLLRHLNLKHKRYEAKWWPMYEAMSREWCSL